MPHQTLMELEFEDKKKLALRSFYVIAIVCIGVSLVLMLISREIHTNLVFACCCGFALLLAARWCRERSHIVTGTLLCMLLCITVTGTSFRAYGLYSPINIAFLLIIVLSLFLVSSRWAVLSLLFALGSTLTFFSLHLFGYTFPRSLHEPSYLYSKFAVDLVVILIVWWVLWLYEKSRVGALRLAEESMQELVLAKEEAEAASRVKSEFLAKVSHELRTPLNAILGYSELIGEGLYEDFNPEEAESDLNNVTKSAKHLLSLINDLLDLSKIEAEQVTLQLETFPLSDLVAQLTPTMQSLVRKNNNEFDVECDILTLEVHSDLFRLHQVLFNLLSNACKFTQDGRIVLRIALEETEEPQKLVIEVRDTGVGMEKEKLDKIFEPFVQADAKVHLKYGGTGLGLAISKELCQLLQSELRVESEPSKGTSFFVLMPLSIEPNHNEDEEG